MVIDRQITIENTLYDMGVRIPLIDEGENSYRVLIPKKGDIKFVFIEKELAKSIVFIRLSTHTKENVLYKPSNLKMRNMVGVV